MRDAINHIVFGWYPYLCLTVFLLGSLMRFDREQYTWKTGSSQLLRRRQMMWGSNLFHVGILVIFFGHFVGLLTPIWVFDMIGIGHGFKQLMAIWVGGVAGIFCLIGIALLTHRRLFDSRIRATSSFADIAILLILFAQLLLGLATIPVSMGHLDGHEMVKFMNWAQGILLLRPDVWMLVADAHPIFKAHLFLGMTIFLVFPFTRLVHVWSAPIWYLGRRGYQVVRSSGRPRAPRPAPRCPASGVMPMGCSIKGAFAHGARKVVSVNGVVIPHDVISREAQHHPAATPIAAWTAAARALAVRELLLQEARRIAIDAAPLSDDEGRTETAEEASIRALVEREVSMPAPDEAACRRYYEQNLRRFRSADLYEAAHILIAASPRDRAAYAAAREKAETLTVALRAAPERFAEFALAHSACPSKAVGGNLGQLSAGDTTPEFDAALSKMAPRRDEHGAGRIPLRPAHHPARSQDRGTPAAIRAGPRPHRRLPGRSRPAHGDRSVRGARRGSRRGPRNRSPDASRPQGQLGRSEYAAWLHHCRSLGRDQHPRDARVPG